MQSISDSKRGVLVLVFVGLLSALAFLYFAIRPQPAPRRILRIGFEHVPPVQIRTGGEPSGLAVEIVSEAARRAGLSLKWVDTGTSSDEAFQRGLVDLWPIMGDLPYRRKLVHITQPWLHVGHALVMRPGTEIPSRSSVVRIALVKMPIHLRLVRQEFPDAQLIELSDGNEVVKEVCKGTVAAGFMDDRGAVSALRASSAECGSTVLRVENLPRLTMRLGLGSTFQTSPAADEIRGEIGKLFQDGTFSAVVAKYSYYGIEDTWATYDLIQAVESARLIAWGVGVLGVVLALVVWQTASLRQRKRSEAALRVSEERFRAIFDQAAVGVAQVALEGHATMVNDRYCEVLGYTREELLGKKLADHTHPDDVAALLANRNRLLSDLTPSYSMEMRYVRKDGEITWVMFHESLVREGDNRPKYFVAAVEDFTKRKQAEAALQESEKRFRSMADTAPVMIWVAGADKLCTFFNQGWLTFTGVTLEKALGNGWSTTVHSGDRESCYSAYSSAFDTRSHFQTECRLRRADGEYRWVVATGIPRFESSGAFAGYVGTCMDITDIKGAHEDALARQKLEGLGVLAGGIAHDFNNLLGSILTTSELVLSDLPRGSSHDGVESIKNVADRAAGIVRQMMAYAGQGKMAFEPLDMAVLVSEMLDLLKVSISKRAVLTVDLPENLPPVRANADQVRRIVMNLITNASEALGEREGTISLVLEHLESEPNPLAAGTSGVSQNGHLRLTVSDTGCGMTEATRVRIFDPYFTTKVSGRGLGLAAVQGIVRDHGGAINVVSIPRQGSTFEVLLPCTSHATKQYRGVASPGSAVEAGSVDGNVLVVEDEEHLRVAVAKLLRKQGCSVLEASDGEAGIELFQTHQGEIDVVLLDLTLPGASGGEVLTELRRMRPDVKVIIATAYGHDTALKAIGRQEPCHYIQKPYRISDLSALLRDVSHNTVSSRHSAD